MSKYILKAVKVVYYYQEVEAESKDLANELFDTEKAIVQTESEINLLKNSTFKIKDI